MSFVELTERLLMDAGGWQAAKMARALVDSGRVVSASYHAPVLNGVVREGDQEYRAGLKIASKSDIENLCTCRASRQWGTICAHSLAVGYALVLHKTGPGSAQAGPPPAPAPVRPPVEQGPRFVDEAEGGSMERVALSVVLPPQFLSAWERGNLTVGVEAERGGRRALLNTLPSGGAFRCSAADLKLIAAVRAFNGGALAGMLILPREKALVFLMALQGHPRVTFGKTTAVHLSGKPLLPRLEVKPDAQGRVLLHVDWPADAHLLAAGQGCGVWALKGTVFSPVAPGLPPAYADLLRRDIMLAPEQAGAFLATELPALRAFFEVSGQPVVAGAGSPQLVPEAGVFSLTLEGSLNHLSARLQRVYSKRVVTLGVTSPSENWALPDPADPSRILCRNLEAERMALGELTRYGFTGPDSTGHYVLRGERAILTFFGEGYPAFAAQWEVSLGPRFTHVSAEIERITPRVEIIRSGEQWFDLQFDLSTGSGERFSAAEVQRLLQLGQNHLRLKSGKVAVFNSALLDDFQSVLRDCNPQQQTPGSYRIAKAHAGYLEAAAAGAGFAIQAGASWREWARSQQGQTTLEPVPLGDLEPVLRNYQKHGVSWLTFLSSNGLGGILADDMGLGKTLQALAYLRTQPGPSLVVCPSSLIFNWQREAEKFTPDRKVLVLEGPQRARHFAEIPQADLVVTSYPLLRRDAVRYRGFEFSTVFLDEAQHIKNPDTQNAQAAGMLRARHRFILTGTPVENSVRDIWSLMHFIMPGYLGDRDDFRERYELPLSRGNDPETLARLSKRLRPFLLRRRKQEVATDLPQKLENVAYCELTQAQKEVYAALLQGARAQIDTASGEKNQGKARMLMLTALLRLRQAACDLRLLKGDAVKHASGKVELFHELLEEAVDGGHRVLVFSQFVSMLTLLRRELEAAGMAVCYLDGQTRDRAAEVDRFQNGDAPVFLISLKAGGTGLNLTAADTVIHFDPWWNPAVEAQATDRAHRIGQKHVVTAYKLIARGTVEEKILHLQRKKREMIEAAIENEEPLMEGLTMDEIRGLLE
ncbi:MAG: SNF2-related protein [Chthoniobacteraceae bacterium]|nr:SNF2-related protein [Chthoniobacteraceae bacterium]